MHIYSYRLRNNNGIRGLPASASSVRSADRAALSPAFSRLVADRFRAVAAKAMVLVDEGAGSAAASFVTAYGDGPRNKCSPVPTYHLSCANAGHEPPASPSDRNRDLASGPRMKCACWRRRSGFGKIPAAEVRLGSQPEHAESAADAGAAQVLGRTVDYTAQAGAGPRALRRLERIIAGRLGRRTIHSGR